MEKSLLRTCPHVTLFIVGLSTLAACSDVKDSTQSNSTNVNSTTNKVVNSAFSKDVVYAINLGGDDYSSSEGISYSADQLNINAEVGQSIAIKGSQDPLLYQSYRKGDMDLSIPLHNGVYDITLKFAEPEDTPIGGRLIDVEVEQHQVLNDLDVRLARDGRILSSLDRTVSDIVVADGVLNIKLTSKNAEAVLHGLVIRKKLNDERDWRLTWQDEFDYDGQPDASKWSFNIWPARKVNDEDQAYTQRSKNVRVENGTLVLEAHREDYNNAKYTSGRIHSAGKGDFLYGKAEISARIPSGQGTWSALWMLPSDPYKYATSCEPNEDWQGSRSCDAWPNSGEIDIMEYVGYDPTTVHGTVHNKAYYWINWEQRKGSIQVDDKVNTDFQTYSVEWAPDYLFISMNNTPYFYYHNHGEGWQAWPFDHPYHLILNLAIGGVWGKAGGPIDDSIFPVKMEVDYVRVYSLSNI